MSRDQGLNRFSFANGANAQYIDQVYAMFKSDPTSVDASWQVFFEGYEFAAGATAPVQGQGREALVEAYINAFRRLGHLNANLNPLVKDVPAGVDLTPAGHGLTDVSGDELFFTANLPFTQSTPFKEIQQLLLDTYCGPIGADFRETNSIGAAVWLQQQMEGCRNRPAVEAGTKLRILDKLIEAEGFERFLQDRYLGQKRFSLEGLEAAIPLLDCIASEAASAAVEEMCLGMAHRGRLNVLANFLEKPSEMILKEFEGTEFNPYDIDGDVKYHKGFTSKVKTSGGRSISLHLSPNPSHLEVVNPVVEGVARARQQLLGENGKLRVLPVLLHGDASFVGQGLVSETLNLSHLDAYSTGGTIHIITNNQVGFTTDPSDSRSCTYSSDIAKMIRAPVLHVNADDPEAVIWSAKLAIAYRQKFQADFVIDMIGYRRHGHNETDEPSFTQPLMYKVIKNHPSVLLQYSQKLVREGVTTEAQIEAKVKALRDTLQTAMETVRAGKSKAVAVPPPELAYLYEYTKVVEAEMCTAAATGVSEATLQSLGKKICEVPSTFTPHPKVEKLLKSRLEMLTGAGDLDWGMAEILAYASLAAEGHHVRLSGQDCQRGTFSHRHAVIRDYETNKPLHLLNQIGGKQAQVEVINSPLSEQGVLGFEFGYSVAMPSALTLWEAQFGDFANGAQIIIDQFLVASEAKWKQTSGLVLLLPHGHEGQGPEHSSARPERFLQLCGSANIQVANPTTPAQYFHILRRQLQRSYRKPLVIMTPKSLLRHPQVKSTLAALAKESFREILDDPAIVEPKKVERVLFCTGKIYYELAEERQKIAAGKAAIVRLEQLYPFHEQLATSIIGRYPNVQEMLWVQEEPSNMGAWTFIRHRLKQLLPPDCTFRYVGRQSSGTTAEGSVKAHAQEQARIVRDALVGTEPPPKSAAKAKKI